MSTIAAAQRAEQSASLRQGLAVSAGFHLTLAVLLFGVLGAMRQPFVAYDIPTGDPPRHDPLPPPGDPPPGGDTRVVVIDPTRYDVVDPVEDEDAVERDDPDPVSHIAPPSGEPGPGEGGDTSNGSSRQGGFGGSGTSGEESFPNPNEPSFADIQPEVIRRVLPSYPDIARQTGVEGRVLVRVLIDPTGAVRKVEVESSSPLFDDAAIEAVRQWTFRPAIESGEPVAAWIRIPIVFRMK